MVYSTSTATKCRAKNPATCNDPKCPELRHVQRAMANAARSNNFSAFVDSRDRAEQRNQDQTRQQLRPVPRPPIKPNREKVQQSRGITGLFHADLGFPSAFNPPTGTRALQYTQHAQNAALDDRYGDIQLPSEINLDEMKLIEVGVTDGQVSKFLYRGKLDNWRDICIVAIPRPRGQKWIVKTVWINESNDRHRTLDPTKYLVPKKKTA